MTFFFPSRRLRTRFARVVLSALTVGLTQLPALSKTKAQEATRGGNFEATEPVRGASPTVADDEATREHLARPDYSRRQQATLEMWRERELSREKVQRAARDPDPEVSGRAKWILRQWRRGALPDTPPDISRLLERANGPAAIEQLLEGGQFNAAIVAIEESAGTVEREAIQQRVVSALQRRFPIYVHLALRSESLPQLLELLDVVADSKEMAICRLQLLHETGMEFSDDALLPRSSKLWSAIEIEKARTLALIILERMDEALQEASKSVDESLLQQTRLIAGRWETLAQESVQRARNTEDGSSESIRHWCMALMAADRSGNKKIRAEAIEKLTTAEQSLDGASEIRWACLAMHGEVDAALQLIPFSDSDSAASIAIDASRPTEAFEALHYPKSQLDQKLDQWITEGLEAQANSPLRELSPSVRRLLSLMHCLNKIGRDQEAFETARRMCESDVRIGSLQLREYVLSAITMTRRKDWLVELAVSDSDKTVSQTTLHTTAKTLNDADAATLEILMQALPSVVGPQSLSQQFRTAYELLDGEIPEGFDTERHFQKLFDVLLQPRPSRRGGRIVVNAPFQGNMDFVKLFSRHGRADLATPMLRTLAESGDVDAMLALAQYELDGGRAEVAMRLFESVYEKIEQQGKDPSEFATVDDSANALKALVGQWTVARRLGDQQLGQQLYRELRLSLCAPSTQLRFSVANHLGDQGETELALETFQTLLPMAVLGNPENVGLYDVARSYAMLAYKTDPKSAAKWFDMAVRSTLDSMGFRAGAYVTLPLYVSRWNLEAAIDQGDAEAASAALERILALDPLDIDFAERLLPKMREAAMTDLADQTLERIMQRGMEYHQQFPFDAMTANNLAWVAAMNDRHLDEALQLSQDAVQVEPESAVYRDTLAEILFRRGDIKQALQVEKHCLLDDPDQWHLHEQIEKYTRALNKAVPEPR